MGRQLNIGLRIAKALPEKECNGVLNLFTWKGFPIVTTYKLKEVLAYVTYLNTSGFGFLVTRILRKNYGIRKEKCFVISSSK